MRKKILLAVGILAGVVTSSGAVFAARSAWNGYRWAREEQRWQAALAAEYQADTSGGATPEQTWNLYAAALAQGNVTGAARYFAVEKQSEWRSVIRSAQQSGILARIVRNLGALRFDRFNPDNSIAHYYRGTRPVKFILNPVTRVWKILTL